MNKFGLTICFFAMFLGGGSQNVGAMTTGTSGLDILSAPTSSKSVSGGEKSNGGLSKDKNSGVTEEIKKSSFVAPIFVQKFLTENECYKEGMEKLNAKDDCQEKDAEKLKNNKFEAKGIMIHSTASPGNMAAVWFNWWNNPYKQVCVHFFVDNKSVYQYLPCNFKSWHCGGEGNNIYLSIEMCEPAGIPYNENHSVIMDSYDKSSHDEYFKKAWNNMVWLCCSLCKTFGFTVDKISLENQSEDKTPAEKFNIIGHKEGNDSGGKKFASPHVDPGHWWKFFDKNMDDFRNEVRLGLANNFGVKLENLNVKKDTSEN